MLKSVIIPQWVLNAVQKSGAPFETVLDAHALSSILSPSDVGFYLASTEIARTYISNSKKGVNTPSYHDLFRSFHPLHIDNFDWVEDALERSEICQNTRDRLLQIEQETRIQYNGMMNDIDQNVDKGHRVFATLWKDPSLALSGNIPNAQLYPHYVPALEVKPILIRDPKTLRCTGLDQCHFSGDRIGEKIVVMGLVFSESVEGEDPGLIYERSFENAMQAASTYFPIKAVMGLALLSGYINSYFAKQRAA